MKKLHATAIIITVMAMSLSGQAGEAGKHLFILSGQSNMARLKPQKRFTPHVEKAFGKESVIVVDDSQSGQPIRQWYNLSEPAGGSKAESPEKGQLYHRLMEKVNAAIKDQKVATVTFIWMQGESDAQGKGKVNDYEANVKGLIGAIKKDLGRDAMNCVIGRISDYGLAKKKALPKQRAWTRMREIQMKVAKEMANCEWIDTDDLNNKDMNSKELGGDIHYTGPGYDVLGQRFAEKAIEMIKKK